MRKETKPSNYSCTESSYPVNPPKKARLTLSVEGEMGRKECLHFLVCFLFAKWRKLLLLSVCFETDRKCWVKPLKTELLEISVRWVLEGITLPVHSHPQIMLPSGREHRAAAMEKLSSGVLPVSPSSSRTPRNILVDVLWKVPLHFPRFSSLMMSKPAL